MHDLSYLNDVVILLVLAVCTVVFLNKLSISPVLGYLIMGAIVGNNGLHLIGDTSYIEGLAEFGVVFLLFVIGLELSFERLMKMRFYVFGFGSLQLVITAALLSFIFHWLDKNFLHYNLNIGVVIVIGMTLALSSTAIVLQVLAERGKKSGTIGRLSLSVLLMQDLSVVPLLAILPMLDNGGEGILEVIGAAGFNAIVAIAGITILGRLLLRPFFSLIASVKTDEVYVTTALLIVLSAALVTSNLGLSAVMGAFMAGILIAETEYRNRIEESITPFQGLFLSLFFISVGMSIDWRFILLNWQKIIICAFALLVIKGAVIYILCFAFRMKKGLALHAAMTLSQGSEFAFVLFGMAAKRGILDNDFVQLMLMTVAVTMALTPILSIFGSKIEDKIDYMKGANYEPQNDMRSISSLTDHVIIAGFGRVGRIVVKMLEQQDINYLVIDADAMVVKKARKEGFSAYHGSISDAEVLEALGANRAALIILNMSDKLAVSRAIRSINEHFPSLLIISRVEDLRHSKVVKKVGATATVPIVVEAGLQLGSVALQSLGIPDHAIASVKERTRKDNYALLEEVTRYY